MISDLYLYQNDVLGASDTDGPHLDVGDAVATLMHATITSAIHRRICESSLEENSCITMSNVMYLTAAYIGIVALAS